MREISINTYSYIWSMPAADCVRRLSDFGYRHFELMIHPPHLPLDDFPSAARRELRAAVEAAGAKISSINLPSLDQNLASPFKRARVASVAMFVDAIDLAADLGVPWFVTVPSRMSPLFPPSPADRTAWMTESIEALLPHAEARGVGLAVENIPFAAFPDAASLGHFVRGFKSSSLGVCYDAANAHFIGESPAEGVARLSDLLRVAHLSDTTRKIWRHDRIGLGDVPVAEFAHALDDAGFDGPCTLEIIDPDPDAAILASHRAITGLGFPPVRQAGQE
jgi:L-ribulose-5-phosphate 3-epimerase